MKLNLGCGTDIRNGYINIDRIVRDDIPSEIYKQGDIESLDWFIENNTVEEILALDCLEYLPIDRVQPSLVNWANKLVKGGVLKILVPDCYAVARSFVYGQFSLQEYATIVFGTQKTPDEDRLSLIDAQTLSTILKDAGLTISLKRYEGIAIYVEATKC